MAELERVEVPAGDMTFTGLAAGPEGGELVLLLHGFPQTAGEWRHQLVALAGAGYRAVAIDQRGYSDGARPTARGAYALGHLVADVLAVADWIGGHTFHLVGHDWGGGVAWTLAARYPGRVRTLTVVSTPHPRALAHAFRRGHQLLRSAYMPCFALPGADRVLLARDAALLRRLLVSSGMPEDEREPTIAAMARPGVLGAALRWYRDAARPGAARLPDVEVPTLYVWGEDDVALRRRAAERTARHVRGPYRFEPLAGVGHWVTQEAPERLDALLLQHLAGAGGRGSPPR